MFHIILYNINILMNNVMYIYIHTYIYILICYLFSALMMATETFTFYAAKFMNYDASNIFLRKGLHHPWHFESKT